MEGSGYATDSFLTAIAKGAGVPDIARWNRDRRSQAVLAEVARTTNQAGTFGFNGTPSFVVEGPNGTKPIGTPQSAAAIEAAIGRGAPSQGTPQHRLHGRLRSWIPLGSQPAIA